MFTAKTEPRSAFVSTGMSGSATHERTAGSAARGRTPLQVPARPAGRGGHGAHVPRMLMIEQEPLNLRRPNCTPPRNIERIKP
jgi:hypothetical protein